MSKETNSSIRSLITQYETLNENSKQIDDILDEANDKGDQLLTRLDGLQVESQDFDQIEQKLNQTKDNQGIVHEIEVHKANLNLYKDKLLHNSSVVNDYDKNALDLEVSIEQENGLNQVKTQRHAYNVDYKNQLFGVSAKTQDALISDLQDQLSKISVQMEHAKSYKTQLQSDAKDRKVKASSLNSIHEESFKTLQEKTKPQFDEMKLNQVSNQNATMKFRIQQATRDGDASASQLIAIKDKLSGVVNEIKIMEGYKVVNDQLKEDIEQLSDDYRKLHANEKQLREQNARITKQLHDKQRILEEKEAILEIKKLENEVEEKPRSKVN